MAPFLFMRIKVLKATAASGVHLVKGKIYNVSDFDGQFLINLGKAKISVQKPKKTTKSSE